jgi:phage terminase large subunit-like protein
MQDPTSEEGAIIKRDWWNKWDSEILPPLKHIIQSYDTAFSAKESADYSAITTWGIFQPREGYEDCIYFIRCYERKVRFP